MKKIYIFGVGKGKEILRDCMRSQGVQVMGYLDNRAGKYGAGMDGLPVLSPQKIGGDYDYIAVSVMKYKEVEAQLLSLGIDGGRIINFFSLEDAMTPEYWRVFRKTDWRVEILSYHYITKTIPYMRNVQYEIADAVEKKAVRFPTVLSADIAVDKICAEHVSLARFGDGEFELMQMRKRAKFEAPDRELARRLKEILVSKSGKVLIAVANNYGSLEAYTEDAAYAIRQYLTEEVRAEHMELLDLNKVYYDAYLSRPYVIYRDKKNAKKRFDSLRKIWEKKEILIVEGEKSRLGVGNDLFDQASSIQRVLGPSTDAFLKHQEIFNAVCSYGKDKLILISLGPAATVLAYDLALSGYWALDIGHVDLEYEWYLRGIEERCDIPYKYVNEVKDGEKVTDLDRDSVETKWYERQIIERIL